MKLIDADKLNIYDVSPADGFVVMGVTEEDIALAPSIDICFCEECKHTDGNPPIADGRYWCEIHGSFMYYCSDGERSSE